MKSDILLENKNYTNNSTVRTFEILENMAKAAYPLSLTEISEITNIDITTVRRFIFTLQDLGYVEKFTESKYIMTSRILDLSSGFLNNVSIRDKSISYLEKFCEETNSSVSIGILDGKEVVYIANISVKQALSVGVRIGSRLPAHATAIGKVLLASLPGKEVEELYENKTLPVYTSRTISKVPLLLGALVQIKNQGFSVSEEEYEEGVRAASCPILDTSGKLIHAINVSMRKEDISKVDFYTKVIPALLKTSYKITKSLR